MKKLFLSALLLIGASQIASAYKVFAELVGSQKGLFSNKVTVKVDFGQNVSFWKSNDMKLVDSEGKDIVFNSMVDAMNFMGTCGWDFVQAYVVTSSNQNVYHWLMQKEVNSEDEIKAGFNVKADYSSSNPTYILTFLKKKKKENTWDVVDTETRQLTAEEAKEIMEQWKAQTNETYDYDCQIKKR